MNTISPVFKALADRNRLRAFAALCDHDELCACQLIELLQVSGATASRHMALLVSAGLVSSRKEGRWVYYRLNPESRLGPVMRDLVDAEKDADVGIAADRKALEEILACEPEELCRRQRGAACCP